MLEVVGSVPGTVNSQLVEKSGRAHCLGLTVFQETAGSNDRPVCLGERLKMRALLCFSACSFSNSTFSLFFPSLLPAFGFALDACLLIFYLFFIYQLL